MNTFSDHDEPGGEDTGEQGEPQALIDQDPAGRLNRHRDLYGNLRVLWTNHVPDSAITATSAAGFDAQHLLFPGSSLKWRTQDLSDQATLRLDLGVQARSVSTLVLHDTNLSSLAQLRVRAGQTPPPEDLVLLPTAELGRGGDVQGSFSDVAHGIDNATPGSVSLPPAQAYAVAFGAPASPPLSADEAGLVRVRLRTAYGTSKVTLQLRLLQTGGAYVTSELTLDPLRLPAGAIAQAAFHPGDLLDPMASVELQLQHVGGDAALEVEEIDLVYEGPGSDYDSRWLPARDPLPSELAQVIDQAGGHGTLNVSHLLSDVRTYRYWQLSPPRRPQP